jgi:hypothetical protein
VQSGVRADNDGGGGAILGSATPGRGDKGGGRWGGVVADIASLALVVPTISFTLTRRHCEDGQQNLR